MGGPLRVWGRWWRSRKICAGPVDAATQCVFCEAGVDARARQTSECPAEVGGWASKGEMEGGKGRDLCPGERTVVVKINGVANLVAETRRNRCHRRHF